MRSHNHISDGYSSVIRCKFELFQFVIALVDERQTCMAVSAGITVTGEMLAGRDNALTLESLDVLHAHFAYKLRIRTERAGVDYRIRGIIVNVENGCKVSIDAERHYLAADYLRIVIRIVRIIRCSECHVSACGSTCSETVDTSALLICTDQHRNAAFTIHGSLLYFSCKPDSLRGILDIISEKAYTVEVVILDELSLRIIE